MRIFLSLCLAALAFAVTPSEHVVAVTATVQVAPPVIALSWSLDSDTTSGYEVRRKLPTESTWTNRAALAAGTTAWSDSAVVVGTEYEYQILHGTNGRGYLASGIDLPSVDERGSVVLLVAANQATALDAELTRLRDDLRGDGWLVLRHDVPTGSGPPAVKALIRADYDANPGGVRVVLIVGHVAVPYSGNLNPDGHSDHQGAWPADTYYGDMTGTWTDSSVNNTTASRAANDNVPGDGKFDQTTIPGSAVLAVGRVDLYDMPAFSGLSETDLLRRYLDRCGFRKFWPLKFRKFWPG